MKGTLRVTVVVPARNAAQSLPRLLRALEGQTLPSADFEVVVVDDASSDETAAIAAAGGARVVRRVTAGGSYAARNEGIKAARSAVLAFTDADCIPAEGWLERGCARMATGQRILGGHVSIGLGARPTAVALVDFVSFLDQRACVSKGFAATANMWLDRDVIDRVGLFNWRLRSGGDNEFGQRAGAAGEQVIYAEDVVVVHEARSRPGELARKAYRLGRANPEHRRYASGEIGARALLWRHPGNYLPRRRLWSLGRLLGTGHDPSRRQLVAMHAAHYLFLQLPMVWGSLVGSLRMARAPRRDMRPQEASNLEAT